MKVFKIDLELRDIFCVYKRDEQITLITSAKYPYPPSQREWVKEDNTFTDIKYPFNPDKIIYSTVVIKKDELEEFLQANIPPVIEKEFHYGFNDKRNLLILLKEWNHTLEIGMGIHEGHLPHIYELGQKICESYLKLKAFW